MKIFNGKVAVITGAANGIGRAIAESCAREGMAVVLADVDEEALEATADALRTNGSKVLSVRADVTQRNEVEAMAQRTLDAFGAVHLLVNNAGVVAGGAVWESTPEDWEWVLRVNLWGIIHGLQVFVPIMLAQDTEGHIVNTASVAGLLPHHPSAPYQVSKHAVVALTEHLYHSLMHRQSKLRASVLCPGWVNTGIMDGERNRPSELRNPAGTVSPDHENILEKMREDAQNGISARAVAEQVFQAIREEELYILTHPELNPAIRRRTEHVLRGRPEY